MKTRLSSSPPTSLNSSLLSQSPSSCQLANLFGCVDLQSRDTSHRWWLLVVVCLLDSSSMAPLVGRSLRWWLVVGRPLHGEDLVGGVVWTGPTSLSLPLVASAPPPILHPLHSYTTHLTPPIHQHRSLEVLNLDLFHDLPVKGVLKSSSDFHAVQ